MRVASLLAALTFLVLASASACEAQRRSPAPFGTRAAAPPPDGYQLPSERPQSWERHVTVGMVAGGAAGLMWGLTRMGDEQFINMSPVIETVIGIGVGLYAGTAVYIVKRLRR